MSKLFGLILFLTLSLSFVTFSSPAKAVCDGYNPDDPYGVECGNETRLTNEDPRLIIARIIRIALSVVGILLTIIIIYAGFKWMTAGGKEDEAKSAINMIFSAVIGLLIILAAFGISTFVINQLREATGS